jgi:hypothetical protein
MRRSRASWLRHGRQRLFAGSAGGYAHLSPSLAEARQRSSLPGRAAREGAGGRRGPCTGRMAALRGRGALVRRWVRACTTDRRPERPPPSPYSSGGHPAPGRGRNEGPRTAPAGPPSQRPIGWTGRPTRPAARPRNRISSVPRHGPPSLRRAVPTPAIDRFPPRDHTSSPPQSSGPSRETRL